MKLFFAIVPPDGVSGALHHWAKDWQAGFPGEASWYGRADLHLTLKFLGDQPDAMTERWIARGEQAARAAPPIEIAADAAGAFPDLDYPRVLWAGVRAEAGLSLLAGLLDQAAAQEGVRAEDRPYRPHITLARVRTGRNIAPPVTEDCDWRFTAHAFVLMQTIPAETRRKSGGGRYNVVHTFPLTGTRTHSEEKTIG